MPVPMGWAGRLQRLGQGKSMNFIIWLVVGGLIGWIASMIMKTDGQQGVILNVVVGIIGAMLGGWLLAPMFGTGTINQNDFSIAGLGVSLLGAIILLAIVNLVRRGSPR
ncbi:MAG TPA: GlsB/YeaQ/YmgE family stress response membrane protein [Vicinamibacterales bacterium]|nr:GlsB/YeaQ/YmgE family stress response membrane protein [Vicinamibacterales bacterium]